MAEPEQIILPKAIYFFDANALIAAPNTLATQPIAEIVEMAKILGTDMFIPQIAAWEWLARCCADALKAMGRIEREAKQIGSLLGRAPLEVERIPDDDLRGAVRAIQANRLLAIGFQIVSTTQIELADLITLFLDKVPPFNDGDKGFKDAIILETILQHACRDNKFDHIVIVSSDKVFGHSALSSKFAEAGTTVHVVDGAPQDLLPRTVEKLETMLDDARNAIIVRKGERATTFAKKHESEILGFIAKNATISMLLVKGYGRQYGRKKDENDQKLEYARIISVDNIRPLCVESAFAYPSSARKPSDGRKAFLITVRLEIDLTIARTNVFAEPSVPIDNASALLEAQSRWQYPDTEESITVKRGIQVSASVSPNGYDTEDFQDLRLESAY